MSYTLGLDSSTQSISGVVFDTETNRIVCEASVNFGEKLPQYNSPSGFLPNDHGEFHADPVMWLDGLELLLSELADQGAPLNQVTAISGAAQQHATVYLNDQFGVVLGALDSKLSLGDQIQPTLSRKSCPIWMDNTTGEECSEITEAVGRDYLIKTSGSVATARFSGPQIRKFSKQDTDAYQQTEHIHMCSSFMASVLAGKSACLDHTDASGMNLLNLAELDWDHKLIDATAPNLKQKLPELCSTTTVIGTISPYFVEKYGFSADARIVAWAGDNPASLVGMGASEPGRTVLSLGTSYTLFAAMENPDTDPEGYGHVFCNPYGGYMALTCFSNGALTNEHLRQHFDLTWDEFNEIAAPSDDLGADSRPEIVPFLIDEISPPTKANPVIKDPAGHGKEIIPQVIQATFINIRDVSQWIDRSSGTIYLTGGSSRSSSICETIAKIFQQETRLLESPGSVALGAARIAGKTVGL